jgi:hypothetical protein
MLRDVSVDRPVRMRHDLVVEDAVPRAQPIEELFQMRPLASASAWIFVLRPPRERPTACFFSPLFRRMLSGVL